MKERPLELIRLEVTREDIEEMYDRYDSGMADRTTSNAVSLALGRKLKSLCLPKIVSAARHHGCRLHIGRDTYPLPQALFWWLNHCDEGSTVHPATFTLVLPGEILSADALARDEFETAMAA